MISFSVAKAKPQAAAAPARPPLGCSAFGDDSDGDDDEGQTVQSARDTVRRAIEAQAKQSEREWKKAAAEAAERNSNAYAYDEIYDELQQQKTAVEKARRGQKGDDRKTPRFVADMKRSADKRVREQELVDLRVIQNEAQRTDHMFSEVDRKVAPVVTPAYARKLDEQRKQWEEDRKQDQAEREGAAERIGFGRFGAHMLEARTRKDEEERPGEEYEAELSSYLWKKEVERKKARRERYLEMKRGVRLGMGAGDADAGDADMAGGADTAGDADAGADETAAPEQAAEPSPVKEPEPEPEPEPAEAEPAAPETTAARVERLAVAEAARKQRAKEKRRKRMERRNTAEDLDRARDRFLKRKLLRMQLLQ